MPITTEDRLEPDGRVISHTTIICDGCSLRYIDNATMSPFVHRGGSVLCAGCDGERFAQAWSNTPPIRFAMPLRVRDEDVPRSDEELGLQEELRHALDESLRELIRQQEAETVLRFSSVPPMPSMRVYDEYIIHSPDEALAGLRRAHFGIGPTLEKTRQAFANMGAAIEPEQTPTGALDDELIDRINHSQLGDKPIRCCVNALHALPRAKPDGMWCQECGTIIFTPFMTRVKLKETQHKKFTLSSAEARPITFRITDSIIDPIP